MISTMTINYAIVRYTDSEDGLGGLVQRPWLVVEDVPDDIRPIEVLGWLDNYEPKLDSAFPEHELHRAMQAAVAGVPRIKWRGRPGRPKVGPAVEIRLPDGLLERLDELAAKRNISRAALIREMIERGLGTQAPPEATQ